MGRISLRGIWVFSRAFMMILAGGSVPAAGSWIRRIPDMEWLRELAGWLQLEDFYIWPEDRLRKLLQLAPRLFAETGTVQGMMDLVELYTGERPLIAECGPLSGYGWSGQGRKALRG